MNETKVKNILEEFSKSWPADRIDYRRPEDESWKIYGLSLKELLLEDKKAVPELEAGLKAPNKQVRALCSRALGFLNADASVGGLADAVYNDSWETVRLLAADSLGMIFTAEAKEVLNNALEREKHKDVKLHIRIAEKTDWRKKPLNLWYLSMKKK